MLKFSRFASLTSCLGEKKYTTLPRIRHRSHPQKCRLRSCFAQHNARGKIIALVPLYFAKQPSNLIRQQQLWRTNTHDEAATKDRRSRSQNMDQTLKQTCSQEYPESAACVQDPIDSLNSAIRNAHRTSLRPSSTFEPRHPSLKGVIGIKTRGARPSRKTEMKNERKK